MFNIRNLVFIILIFCLHSSIILSNCRYPDDDYNVAPEKMPILIGGIEGIVKKLKYPENAREASVQGTVYLLVSVSEKGEVDEVKVVKSLGHGCDEEAVMHVKQSKFVPGEQDGRKIKTKMALPIKFKLT